MRTIAMIPVRSGSKRLPGKNLKLLGGKPLVAWVIEAALGAGCFNDIYLNSEDVEFRKIADQYGVKFYHRPDFLATDQATNDQFMFDFLKNNPCDYVVQLLATSPFIFAETIREFTHTLTQKPGQETLISVKKIQIECVYDQTDSPEDLYIPINFDKKEHTKPSQSLTPVLAYACGIMGWYRSTYMHRYLLNTGAYHGGIGATDYYPLSGFETLDIDTLDDFRLAEAVVASGLIETKEMVVITKNDLLGAALKETMNPVQKPPKFSRPEMQQELEQLNTQSTMSKTHSETDVPTILKNDGIERSYFGEENLTITSLSNRAAKNTFYSKSWADRIVNSSSNSATLICQQKGFGNRLHYHTSVEEWWYIVKGKWMFDIENDYGRMEQMFAREGDVVFIPRTKKHKIIAVGDGDNIRLAVSRADAEHVYIEEPDQRQVLGGIEDWIDNTAREFNLLSESEKSRFLSRIMLGPVENK